MNLVFHISEDGSEIKAYYILLFLHCPLPLARSVKGRVPEVHSADVSACSATWNKA